MLPTNAAIEKSNTKRQAKLIKNIAATLYDVVGAFNPMSPTTSREILDTRKDVYEEDIIKNGLLVDGAEPGAYDSMSTQISLSRSYNSENDVARDVDCDSAAAAQVERIEVKPFATDYESEKAKLKDRMKRYRRQLGPSDMRETSWDIPKDTAFWYSVSTDSELESLDFFNLKDKEQDIANKFQGSCKLSDYDKCADMLALNSEPLTDLRNLNPCTDSDFVDNTCLRCKKTKARNIPYTTERVVKKQVTKKIAHAHLPKESFNKSKDCNGNSRFPKKVSRKKAMHRSSSFENDLHMTTIIRRPRCSSSVESIEAPKHRSKHPVASWSNIRPSDNELKEYQTLGYLVQKPVAKLRVAEIPISPDNGMYRKSQHKSSKNAKQSHKTRCNYEPINLKHEGERQAKMKAVYAELPKFHVTHHMKNTNQKRKSKKMVPNGNMFCEDLNEESDDAYLNLSRCKRNDKNNSHGKVKKSDSTHYSDVDRALNVLNSFFLKEKKKEKSKVPKEKMPLKRR